MKLKLFVNGIEPTVTEKTEKEEPKEMIDVHFIASLTPEEFNNLKLKTKQWALENVTI